MSPEIEGKLHAIAYRAITIKSSFQPGQEIAPYRLEEITDQILEILKTLIIIVDED